MKKKGLCKILQKDGVCEEGIVVLSIYIADWTTMTDVDTELTSVLRKPWGPDFPNFCIFNHTTSYQDKTET